MLYGHGPYSSLVPEWRARLADVRLTGAEALRAAGLVLPQVNVAGGSDNQVREAVRFVEEAASPDRAFAAAARLGRVNPLTKQPPDYGFRSLSAPILLALEMAAHEEQERRALEGELAELEAAWREAEEVAAIADDLTVPTPVRHKLSELRKG